MGHASKEMVGASAAVMVLSVLKAGANYGYEIVREMNERAKGAFSWQEGTVYPLLHKLERQGMVKGYWQEIEGRRRRYYSLTEKGRGALARGRKEWEMFYGMIVTTA